MDKLQKRYSYDGVEEWTLNGFTHREDGPAVIYPNGSKYWYRYNQLHRLDGPAIMRYNNTYEWYIEGRRMYSNYQFKFYSEISEEDLLSLVLKYGDVE